MKTTKKKKRKQKRCVSLLHSNLYSVWLPICYIFFQLSIAFIRNQTASFQLQHAALITGRKTVDSKFFTWTFNWTVVKYVGNINPPKPSYSAVSFSQLHPHLLIHAIHYSIVVSTFIVSLFLLPSSLVYSLLSYPLLFYPLLSFTLFSHLLSSLQVHALPEVDEAEKAKLLAMRKKRGRRTSVSAEADHDDTVYVAKVVEKTDEAMARIAETVKGSFLFSGLDAKVKHVFTFP